MCMANGVADCFWIYFFSFSELLTSKRRRKNLEVCREGTSRVCRDRLQEFQYISFQCSLLP